MNNNFGLQRTGKGRVIEHGIYPDTSLYAATKLKEVVKSLVGDKAPNELTLSKLGMLLGSMITNMDARQITLSRSGNTLTVRILNGNDVVLFTGVHTDVLVDSRQYFAALGGATPTVASWTYGSESAPSKFDTLTDTDTGKVYRYTATDGTAFNNSYWTLVYTPPISAPPITYTTVDGTAGVDVDMAIAGNEVVLTMIITKTGGAGTTLTLATDDGPTDILIDEPFDGGGVVRWTGAYSRPTSSTLTITTNADITVEYWTLTP